MPHTLHGVHHVALLGQHRIAQVLGPIQVVAHAVQDIREVGQGLHARVPSLIGQCVFQVGPFEIRVALPPAIGLHDLQGVGGGHQNLGYETVRVQGDGRYQLLELIARE